MATVNSVRLQVYAARISNSENTVFQYYRTTDRLRAWEWPSTTSARIHPSELRNYRMSHRMLGPCCLCPLAFPNGPDFVEAAIYMISKGRLSGQYVASCARGKCDYFVFMERLYNKNGLVIKCYPRREFGEQIPPQVTLPAEELQASSSVAGPSRPLKRTYAMLDINSGVVPTNRRVKTKSELLEQLDANVKPGITAGQFSTLFSRCAECGLVTTRRVFEEHECRDEIIDLTGDA